MMTGVFPAAPLHAAVPLPGDKLDIPGYDKHVYKTFKNPAMQDQNLYIYVCKPEGWKASDSRSAIVFIHGGGYANGDPALDAERGRYFAGRGMVTFLIEYRISSRDGTEEEKKAKGWNFWKSRSDCIEAIRWIRSKASPFGIAANKIAVGGWSAAVDATMAATFGWKHVPAEFPCGDVKVSSVPDAVFLENGAFAEIDQGNWYEKGDPVPPMLVLKGDVDPVDTWPTPEAVAGKYFSTMFASQKYKEWREYRSDIAPDGQVIYAANHLCFLPVVNRYYRAGRIDLEEWFATLGFLPDRNVPLLTEANGICQIEAKDFTDRSPRIGENSFSTLRWHINYAKDASQGYLMDCVPPTAETIEDTKIAKAPRLDYRIKISTPGKYYIWANIRSSWEGNHKVKDGKPLGPFTFRSRQLRFGVFDGQNDRMLPGRITTTADGTPSWQRSDPADPIVVSKPGVITLKAYAASAGIRLDQIVLTTDAAWKP